MNAVASHAGASVHISISRVATVVVAVSLAVLLVGVPSFAQGTGRILGTVTDPSGAAIVGATVTITDVAKGVSRTVTTDAAGEYDAPSLSPGTKLMRVDFKGFKTLQRENILLEVGHELRLDFTLEPGAVNETITVTEAAPLVETTNAELGGSLTNQTINDLPLNGRNYENLLTLRPGVTIFTGGGGWTQSTNGIRPDDNVYMLDGLTQNEPWTGMSIVNGSALAGDVQTFIPLDAIQEFKTAQNVRAEYGFKPGSIVNVGLKSGGNDIHGTAYAFGRTDAWDAKNYFDTAAQGFPPFPLSLEQFGATAGGPLKKDKVFWFLAYEGQRYDTDGSFTTTSPVTCSATSPSCGLFGIDKGQPDVINSIVDACNAIGRANVTPLSAKFAGLPAGSCIPVTTPAGAKLVPGQTASLFPFNNATTIPGTNTVFPNLKNVSQADNGLAKIDYHISEHNMVNGYYFLGQNEGTWNDGFDELAPNWESLLYVRSQLANGGWVWTPNSSWVNELRGGYGRYYQTYFSVDHNTTAEDWGINTGVTNPLYGGFPFYQFIGLNSRLGAAWPKIVGPDGVFDFLDHISYLRGKHAIKFGVDVMDNIHTGQITADGKGLLKFKPFGPGTGNLLENYLEGIVGSGSAILTGNAYRDSHSWAYGLFVQDDWRVLPRLTLNLGVRYELNAVLTEANNLLGNFVPNLGMVQVGKGIPSLYNGDHDMFAPRVGLAWDIQGNGKTVLRVGGGIMYEQIAQESFMALGNLLGAPADPTAATLVANGVATPGKGTINLQALSFNGGAQAQLTANYQANGAVPIFPVNATPVCGDGSTVPGVNSGLPTSPCTIFSVDRHLRTPYVSNWTVDLQRQLTNNLSLDVAYVGNHGTKLIGFRDINEINPQSPAEIACGHCENPADAPFGVQFPYFSYINQLSNLYDSNYEGLQVAVTQRTSHGLSFTLGYTYSHALDDASENWSGAGVIDDGFNPRAYYGNSDFDIRHRFTTTVTYAIPGRDGFGQLLKGWQLNSIVTLQGGEYWGMLDTGDDYSGTGETNNIPAALGESWDFFGNRNDFKSNQNSIPSCVVNPNVPGATFPTNVVCTQTTPAGVVTLPATQTAAFAAACFAAAQAIGAVSELNGLTAGGPGGCYAQGRSVMIPPPLGTFGTGGRNVFPSYPFYNWDASIYKDFKFGERLTAQFRAEFFNVLNHPQFANPGGGPNGFVHNDPSVPNQFGCGCATPDVAGENPVLGSGSNRAIQLGLKFIF